MAISPSIRRVESAAPEGLDRLSPREGVILERTARGLTNVEIAHELGITSHAVKFHLTSVFRKLNVKNRTEAASAYWQLARGDDTRSADAGGR